MSARIGCTGAAVAVTGLLMMRAARRAIVPAELRPLPGGGFSPENRLDVEEARKGALGKQTVPDAFQDSYARDTRDWI
jgi:hypothetical protein